MTSMKHLINNQNCQGQKIQGKSEKQSHTRASYEDMTTKYNVSWIKY